MSDIDVTVEEIVIESDVEVLQVIANVEEQALTFDVEDVTIINNVAESAIVIDVEPQEFSFDIGEAGPPGQSAEDLMPYSLRFDDEGDAAYTGWAAPGALETDPVWRIRKRVLVTDANGYVDYQDLWADGDSNFDNVWADHLTLTYF